MSLSQSFQSKAVLKTFYSGGQIDFSDDGNTAAALCDGGVSLFDFQTGQTTSHITTDGDQTNVLARDPSDCNSIVTGGSSLLLRHWRIDEDVKNCKRSWQAHDQPITSLDIGSSFLVSGSMDKSIKVWSLQGYYCTHNFRGHSAPVSHVKFVPSTSYPTRVISVATDFSIKVWCLQTHKCLASFEDHLATVTSIAFSDNDTLVTAGRDQIVNLWCLKTFKRLAQIPTFESISSVACSNGLIATVGEKNKLMIWTIRDGKGSLLVESEGKVAHAMEGRMRSVSFAGLTPITVGEDLSIVKWSDLKGLTLTPSSHFLGSLGEVVSVRRLGDDFVLCATNDENPRVLSLGNGACMQLIGHTDLVLCTAVGGDLMATGGKDGKVLLWSRKHITGSFAQPLAVLSGHTGPVTGVSFTKGKLGRGLRLFSCAEDKTVKCWDVAACNDAAAQEATNGACQVPTLFSCIAHKKAVNDVSVAPNDKVFATGGQDKEAKVFDASNGQLIGTLTGHKRGVWSVAFSPAERVLATASGDTLVKLWNLADFRCIKTFQGHELSALCVRFLPGGMQVMSSGGDGCVKVWNVRTGDCAWTGSGIGGKAEVSLKSSGSGAVKLKFAEEEETLSDDAKVWSFDLTNSPTDGALELTAGFSDGKIVVMRDNTEEVVSADAQEKAENLIKDTKIGVLMKDKLYQDALELAFQLGRPGQMVTILEECGWDASGEVDIKAFVIKIGESESDLTTLLQYLGRWITTSRLSHIAQEMARELFRSVPISTLEEVEGYKNFLETFQGYSQRHMSRVDLFAQRVFVMDAIIQASQKGAGMLGDLAELIGQEVGGIKRQKKM